VHDGPITTFLFTDIEGSTRLWEEQPERMREALARHDEIVRAAVASHGGRVVKMTGDGVHAAFDDPLAGVESALAIQLALEDAPATAGIALRVRCGLHAGAHEMRDGDFYGTAVNRAARVMAAAHGGQVLLSAAVMALVAERLHPDIALRDLGKVRLRDLSAPEHVYQLVHAQLRTDFPALRSLEATPNNLPQELTSFVGRERDVAGVRAIIGRSRLTTITGMGGLGKTRLALHVAAEVQDGFPDGVWLVELADVADPRLVAEAVAGVLGVREEPAHAIADVLATHIARRTLLLVLDNCEHLLDEASTLAQRLLRAGAGVRILATSREPLRAPGESVYVLPALEVPNLRAPFEPAFLMQNEAAGLFVQRARAARADFELTVANAPSVAAVCHRLDGIPLALELAAARVRTLSLDALADRLKDRFHTLKSGDRTAAARQQTLRALIDWSYELLEESERAVLAQLSVFAGGWTLESAEAVCECGVPEDVLDLLERLVEKSLVIHDAVAGRYRMLETVRQYAHERLVESGTASAVRSRHAGHFCALAAAAERGLIGAETAHWLQVLDAERENILAVFARGSEPSAATIVRLQLAVHLKRYWLHRGLLRLGLQVTVDALEDCGDAPASERNAALFAAGQLEYLVGHHSQARRYLEESLALTRAAGDESSTAAVLQSLGMAAQGEGDLATARRHLEEAVRCAQAGSNPRRIAAAMNALGQLELEASNLEKAEPLLQAVATTSRDVGDEETLAIALLNIAMTRILRGSHEAARPLLQETATIAERLGSGHLEKCLLDICAGFAAEVREPARAARFYGAAEMRARQTGFTREAPDEAFLRPLIQRVRGELGAARFEQETAQAALLEDRVLSQEVRSFLFKDPG
jgi:predicted ATPase/class 3 adenylate cyclase